VRLSYKTVPSPLGTLKIVATGRGIAAILWQHDDPRRVRLPVAYGQAHPAHVPDHAVLVEAERQLRQYFAGERREFSLELDFGGGTAFQQAVWRALVTIPYGETRSYGAIARQIQKPKAVRAVGAANGKNPISIVAPCHRVIGASGALTGFAGGLKAKAYLLQLEGAARDR
jgi:methylated-DNA-[protein]-cysteine S-methyltransferase